MEQEACESEKEHVGINNFDLTKLNMKDICNFDYSSNTIIKEILNERIVNNIDISITQFLKNQIFVEGSSLNV